MLALIGGTVFAERGFIGRTRKVETEYGDATVVEKDGLFFIQRHGGGGVPPHRINHRANVRALKDLGATVVIGVGSSGSLKRDIPVGSIVVPDDCMSFGQLPTFHDEDICHVVPALDEKLRVNILAAAKKAGVKVIDGGVYAQTHGPRLETKAEVRMLKRYADLVGMTLASEATLCSEINLPYAAICSVDNLAHGLAKKEPDFAEIKKKSAENAVKIKKIMENI